MNDWMTFGELDVVVYLIFIAYLFCTFLAKKLLRQIKNDKQCGWIRNYIISEYSIYFRSPTFFP